MAPAPKFRSTFYNVRPALPLSKNVTSIYQSRCPDKNELLSRLEHDVRFDDEDEKLAVDDEPTDIVGDVVGPVDAQAALGSDVIVLHPGSSFLRLGRASDGMPRTIVHAIARRRYGHVSPSVPQTVNNTTTDMDASIDDQISVDDEVQNLEDRMELYIAERLKPSKLRTAPATAKQLVISFNQTSTAQTVAEHNDPGRMEWTDVSRHPKFIVGEEAVNVGFDREPYYLRYPFRRGQLNFTDYMSVNELAGDIVDLWSTAIETELYIEPRDFPKFRVMIIITDIFKQSDLEFFMDVLVRDMKFKSICILQESVCATFGAGVAQACVIDVGSQSTSICCVEDGLANPASRINLKFGGDEMTAFLLQLLAKSAFPYADCDLAKSCDRSCLDTIKEMSASLEESDLVVSIRHFYKRQPNKPSKLYEIKMYDEAAKMALIRLIYGPLPGQTKMSLFSSPLHKDTTVAVTKTATPSTLAYFNMKPIEIEYQSSLGGSNIEPTIVTDPVPEKIDSEVTVKPTELFVPPLDDAIVYSILSTSPTLLLHMSKSKTQEDSSSAELVASEADVTKQLPAAMLPTQEERIRKLFSSILVVGGGISLIRGMGSVLEDRSFTKLAASEFGLTNENNSLRLEKVGVIPYARELDPRSAVWKGGAVAARLESVKECWLTRYEWLAYRTQLLKERALFAWVK